MPRAVGERKNRLFGIVWLALVLACGGATPAPVGTDDNRVKRTAAPDAPVAGWMVASVGERTLGPFFARRDSGVAAAGMVAWVTASDGTNRRVVVVPVDARGVPRGAETTVALISVDTTTLVVRPLRGSAPGFVVAWISLTDRGKLIGSVAVDDKGAPRAKPVELTRSNDDLVWLDIIPTDHGAIALWAEETRGGDANLIAAPLDGDGRVRGNARRVAGAVVGWHALELPNGIGVSTVAAPETAPGSGSGRPLRDARPGGALTFHRLDADAHPSVPPQPITPKGSSVSGDVEVVRDGTRLLFAWTDRSTEEPSVSMTSVDDKTIEPPHRIVDARGGASLLALAAGPSGVAVMYEAPARRKGETRRIHVARLAEGMVLERRPLSLEVVGRGQPELSATATGFAILATTADCDADSPTCANAKAVATVLRTDAKGALVQREPLTFGTDPATLGWSMTCDGDLCFSLAASPGESGAPSRIRSAAIRPHAPGKLAAKAAEPPLKAGPRVVDITAVASGESVVDIATLPLGNATMVALLSGREGRKADQGTNLSTRIVGENGEASAPFVVSSRALANGGVAIAGAEKPEDGGALAWISRESGDAEVHVTRIDKRGKRINDVQLTAIKGDASDVTLTWAGNGWLVAWVDWRDGNGEVYAARVSMDLQKTSREERITNAPGDASDLVALSQGTDVWLAWADPRESPKDGLSDIYVSAVHMKDAKRAFVEQRLLATAAHSRTPHLVAGPGGVIAAWIEEAPMGIETPDASGHGAFHVRLGAEGKPVDRPARIPLAGEGAASTVVIEPAGSGLHAVVARTSAEGISLDAVDLSGPTPVSSPLLALDGPPSLDVALVLDGGTLYFNDEGPRPADRRARRARIAWKR